MHIQVQEIILTLASLAVVSLLIVFFGYVVRVLKPQQHELSDRLLVKETLRIGKGREIRVISFNDTDILLFTSGSREPWFSIRLSDRKDTMS